MTKYNFATMIIVLSFNSFFVRVLYITSLKLPWPNLKYRARNLRKVAQLDPTTNPLKYSVNPLMNHLTRISYMIGDDRSLGLCQPGFCTLKLACLQFVPTFRTCELTYLQHFLEEKGSHKSNGLNSFQQRWSHLFYTHKCVKRVILHPPTYMKSSPKCLCLSILMPFITSRHRQWIAVDPLTHYT
jgi:hypothetical protein